MLTLKDLEEKYGFNPNTIMRERWEMKKSNNKSQSVRTVNTI